jgi:hypothetical protein
MYANPESVRTNYVLAHMWSNIASANGEPDARETLEILEERMTKQQIAEAQQRARNWWDTQQLRG